VNKKLGETLLYPVFKKIHKNVMCK